MNRLISLQTKRSAIGITIATNYWIQYHRRDRESLQLMANNGSNGHSLLRNVKMMAKPKPISDDWFAPFVSIKQLSRQSEVNPSKSIVNEVRAPGFICDERGFVMTCLAVAAPLKGRWLVHFPDDRRIGAHLVKTIDAFNIKILLLDESNNGADWPAVELDTGTAKPSLDDTVLSVGLSSQPYVILMADGFVDNPSMDCQHIDAFPKSTRSTKHQLIHHNTYDIGIGFALCNAARKVVGITVIADQSNNVALPMSNKLIAEALTYIKTYDWESDGPPLGIVVFLLDRELRQMLKNDPDFTDEVDSDEKAILVWAMTPEFDNENIALERCDVITHIDGVHIASMDDMYRAVDRIRCLKTVNFTITSVAFNEDQVDRLSESKSRFV